MYSDLVIEKSELLINSKEDYQIMKHSVDYYYASYYSKERSFILDWFKREGLATKPIIASPAIQPKGDEIAYVTSWHRDISIPANVQFINLLKEKTGNEATEFSMLGYESGLIIYAALKLNNKPFNAIQFIESLKGINLVGPRGKVEINEHTQSTYSDHFHIFVDGSTGGQKILSVSYPIEAIKKEIESNQPSNLFGWQNTYLCK